MSTGKRLAKRSIVGTRVSAPGTDSKYYPGVIHAVKTTAEEGGFDTCYAVRLEDCKDGGPTIREFQESDLVGPGFISLNSLVLVPGQRVYLTHNGREVSGTVTSHNASVDEVIVIIASSGNESPITVEKRLEEVRLLASRKSARLQDQDTDFARLADVGRVTSHNIDVPPSQSQQGSRKRRPSYSQDENGDVLDECAAALVLMRLSCSPHSPRLEVDLGSSVSSGASSWKSGGVRSATPSPPLTCDASPSFWSQVTDEGIVIDEFEELPKKMKFWDIGDLEAKVEIFSQTQTTRTVYSCTWPGCQMITATCPEIESHVRYAHLGPKDCEDPDLSDHEEEFYYTEVEMDSQPLISDIVLTSPQPTLSHRDMARPPHEDPEYRRQLHLNSVQTSVALSSPSSPVKYMKLSGGRSGSLNSPKASPSRRGRGETKKCRKVYGMEHREMWCTQCKWKKACARFGDN